MLQRILQPMCQSMHWQHSLGRLQPGFLCGRRCQCRCQRRCRRRYPRRFQRRFQRRSSLSHAAR